MNAMGRRIVANKLIMLVIILVLLFAIGLIVYLKWFNKSKSTGKKNPEHPLIVSRNDHHNKLRHHGNNNYWNIVYGRFHVMYNSLDALLCTENESSKTQVFVVYV